MAERSLRGTRLGSFSMESDVNVVPSERRITTYVCPRGHRTELPFSIDAEVPSTWECRCNELARLLEGPEPEPRAVRPVRTHWDMLLERRSVAELEALLQERLELLRASRGQSDGTKRTA